MRLKVNEAKKLLVNILARHGLKKEEAKIIMEDYIEGELLGKPSHGLLAFPSIIERVKVVKGKGRTTKSGSSFVFIDGQGNFGQIIAHKARELLVKRAKSMGLPWLA